MKKQLIFIFTLFYSNLSLGQLSFQGNILYDDPNYVAGSTDIFVADLDGDGDDDILSSYTQFSLVAWYENLDGQGTFSEQKMITEEGTVTYSVIAEDMDLDGDQDVLCIIRDFSSTDKIVWFDNVDGQGDFSIKHIITSTNNMGRELLTADIDNDGDADVFSIRDVAPFGTSHKFIWFENIDGQGNFGPEQVIDENNTVSQSPKIMDIADLDGDGDFDLALGDSGYNSLSWYENLDGEGTFGDINVINYNITQLQSIFLSDIDDDGDQDISVASKEKIAWYENLDGQATFSSEKIISENDNAPATFFILTTDLDNDGDQDVLTTGENGNPNRGDIVWYENLDGLGTFNEGHVIEDDDDSGRVYHSDIDKDGDQDLVIGSGDDDKVSWYKNNGPTNNKIRGIVHFDINDNGCDLDDVQVENAKIMVTDNSATVSTFTYKNGFYEFGLEAGNYSTSLNLNGGNFEVSPSSFLSEFMDIGDIDTVDFCITPVQSINDLNIVFLPLSEARPGFDASYQLAFRNLGTSSISGSVSLEYDDGKINFLNGSIMPNTQTTNSLVFSYEDLNPFEIRTIELQFNILPPPTVEIDETLSFTTSVNPIIGDDTEEDNIYQLEQTVIGSYDPNDIQVLEGDMLPIVEAGNYLHYIIRFQNTGTADAINIRVENILDIGLDWSTFELLTYSHDNRVEINDGNTVYFNFDGIYLPDSTSNEPESHGFISYRIKSNNNIQTGDIIQSKADIYFDFNPPIETNTATTEYIQPTSILQINNENLIVYPNPTNDIFFVNSDEAIIKIELYNWEGNLVLSNNNHENMDIKNLPQGVYFCKIFKSNDTYILRRLIKNKNCD